LFLLFCFISSFLFRYLEFSTRDALIKSESVPDTFKIIYGNKNNKNSNAINSIKTIYYDYKNILKIDLNINRRSFYEEIMERNFLHCV